MDILFQQRISTTCIILPSEYIQLKETNISKEMQSKCLSSGTLISETKNTVGSFWPSGYKSTNSVPTAASKPRPASWFEFSLNLIIFLKIM